MRFLPSRYARPVMSDDKFELARIGIEEFNRTHRASEFFADDLVFDFSGWEDWIEDSEYFGREGFDRQFGSWTEPFQSWSWELADLIDAGGDDILAIGIQRGTLAGSHTAVEMPVAQIWTIRDGQVHRIRMFKEPAHAYRAAGLEVPAEHEEARS
jgi:ketosteroid isomerase-like protein